MLRRVAHALHARVRVVFEPEEDTKVMRVAEGADEYGGEFKGVDWEGAGEGGGVRKTYIEANS